MPVVAPLESQQARDMLKLRGLDRPCLGLPARPQGQTFAAAPWTLKRLFASELMLPNAIAYSALFRRTLGHEHRRQAPTG